MHDLDTIKRMNNESGEYLTGKAQTLAEIQAEARQETVDDCYDNLTPEDWPERNDSPTGESWSERNEH